MAEIVSHGDGIHQVTLPLPFASPRSVNCYLIEGNDGLTVLDCGVLDPATLHTLDEAVAELSGGEPRVVRLIGSHLHPDHMAAAARFSEQHQCEFVMHSTTGAELAGYNDWTLRRADIVELAVRHGAPPEEVASFDQVWPRPEWAGRAIAPTRPVDEGDRLPLGGERHLEVIYTPGHHVTHICLRDSLTGRLFTGDHVLPRITPFVAVDLESGDSLADFLANLERVEELDPGLTYPAHGAIIEHGRARARQIALHHERRIEAMLDEIRTVPRTAWAIMEATFRPDLDVQGKYLAFQETLAHLEHMVRVGRARRFEDDGLWRYRGDH
jgi:glyoxylase-like metal-dependent hydrolase (beta-lactamase superfamily II)